MTLKAGYDTSWFRAVFVERESELPELFGDRHLRFVNKSGLGLFVAICFSAQAAGS